MCSRERLHHSLDAFPLGENGGADETRTRDSCVAGSIRNTILLARLALFYVIVHGLGWYWGVADPSWAQVNTVQEPHRRTLP